MTVPSKLSADPPEGACGAAAGGGATGALRVVASGERDIVMTRAFAAPRQRVWEALTRPDLVRRWLLGPPGWTMTVCEMDLRVGGSYRHVWRRDGDGHEMGMGGEYREIAPPSRLVATEVFDHSWYPGHAIDTTELSERGGVTTLTLTVRYESREARDGVLKGPMARGVSDSYDRLEALLASAFDRAQEPETTR